MTRTEPAVVPLAAGDLVHAPAGGTEWWRDAVIYQVYPRSFADGNGDGIGDLPGITARLDHLAKLGVDAIWLSPFYRSPQRDAGYDVADYRQIDPLFGTLDDFDAMRTRAHELGLRVIVDLVPNHSSDQHVWFQEALAAAPGSPERERYMFRDGKGPTGAEPPNNWQSIFGGPAWTRLEPRDDDGPAGPQWYLHLFDSSQPDLNWENPEVHEEFENVLRFWLDRGVDGFRVDVAHGMIKEKGLPDWDGKVAMVEGSDTRSPADDPTTITATTGERPNAADEAGVLGGSDEGPMFDRDGVHEIYREWHKVLAEYEGERCLVAEAWVSPMSRLAMYVRPDEMHQAFNFAFLTTQWDAPSIRDVVTESLETMDSVGAPTTWVLSNHDVVRHASRLGLDEVADGPLNGIGPHDTQPDADLGLRRARAATLLMLALPGSAYIYQGEELGLPDHTTLPDDVRQDPAFFRTDGEEVGRDGCRIPLPWEADKPGLGFGSSDETWLPQPDSYGPLAADQQYGVPGSTFEMYRNALARRRAERLGQGGLAWVAGFAEAKDVVALRVADVVVVANLGTTPVGLPADAEVLISSSPLTGTNLPTDTTVWLRG